MSAKKKNFGSIEKRARDIVPEKKRKGGAEEKKKEKKGRGQHWWMTLPKRVLREVCLEGGS